MKSWVTLLASDDYIYGVIELICSLKRTQTKYQITVLVTENISNTIINILKKLNVNIININIADILQVINENALLMLPIHAAIAKLKIFNLVQFNKIVFLDADMWINSNIDDLFNFSSISATRDACGYSQLFCANLLVLEPNNTTYLKILDFIKNKFINTDENSINDQDILQQFFSTDFTEVPKSYSIWATDNELIDNLDYSKYKCFHIVCEKPWRLGLKYYRDLLESNQKNWNSYATLLLDYSKQINNDININNLELNNLVDVKNDNLFKTTDKELLYNICETKLSEQSYSWVTLLTNDIYIYGIITLVKTLRETNTIYPISVIITSDISEKIISILNRLEVNIILKDKIKPNNEYQAIEATEFIGLDQPGYHAALTKFEIYNLTQFDKIVYLDSDIWVKQNIDDLFNFPNGAAIKDVYGTLDRFCSGLLVVEPNTNVYLDLINFFNTKYIPTDNLIHDQDVLQKYFNTWIDNPELQIPIEYNLWITCPNINLDDESNIKSYHMIDKKPWIVGRKYYEDCLDNYFNYCTLNLKYIDRINSDLIEFRNILKPIGATSFEGNFMQNRETFKKLCVYSIIKNEIDHLEEWYNRVKSADYIYLLDTGSTDGTLEKIEELGIPHSQKIYDYFNFATARNDCLNLAKEVANDNSWIFGHFDIDEYLDDNCISEIKLQWSDDYDQMSLIAHNVGDMTTPKIHSGNFDLFWDYAIHETIRSKTNRQLAVKLIEHTGYNHYQNTNKPRNYYEKLKLAIKHEGLRVRYLIYAAWEAILHNEPDACANYAAIGLAQILYNSKDEYYKNYYWATMAYYYMINIGTVEEKINLLKNVDLFISQGNLPDFRNQHVKLAKLYLEQNNIDAAKDEYLNALKIKTPLQIESWLDETDLYDDEQIYIELLLLCYYNNLYSEAVTYAIMALNLNDCELNRNNLQLCIDRYNEVVKGEN